jgi:putative NIF3 family GTP cyclohydrolase 1 type 2
VLPSSATGVRVAGSFETRIRTVAVCGGAGDSFIEGAYDSGADVYVTSDLRHHPVQEILERSIAEKRSFALIDISHWAAEWMWLEWAAADIQGRFASVQVVVSELRTDPWDFAVTQ